MDLHYQGLYASRLLAALSELENVSQVLPPRTGTLEDYLHERLVETLELICRQYHLDPRPIIEQLYVSWDDDDRGHDWYTVSLESMSWFQVRIPVEQLWHWFGKDV